MRIVDSEHAPSCRVVQRQRIAEPMRPGVVWRHARRHDLHPEAATDLGQKAIEIEEPLETLVPALMTLIYQILIT